MNNIEKPTMSNPIHFFAFCGGIGLIGLAPGTAGTLFGILVWWLTLDAGFLIQSLMAIIFLTAGIWICGKCAKDLNVHDHPGIVWDEMATMFTILLFQPMNWQNWLLAFILFRCFDIFKPWPISYIDKNISGGLGIMLDDIVAGVATIICLLVLGQISLV